MAFITFNYNKNLNYAIVYWALEIISRSFIYFEWEYFRIVTDDAINEYIYLFLLNISDLLAGFFVLYINYSSKKKKVQHESDNETAMTVEFVSVRERYFTTKSFIYKIIIICCLNYLNNLTSFIFYSLVKKAKHENISYKVQTDIINHLDIISRYIFSIVLLENKVFKHHKFSIIVILIAFFILIPTDTISLHFFPKEQVNEFYTYMNIGFFCFRGVLFPFEDTLTKKVFTDDYAFPEFCMFLRGLGEFVLILIITPILYFTLWSGKIIFNENLGKIALSIILYTLSSFIKEYLLMKVIYYFSSQSVSFLVISQSITGSICEIIKYFKSDESAIKSVFFIIEIIVILITMFGTLVYDEIIIIKKCGLDTNVATEISSRARSEINSISNFDDERTEDDNEEDEDIDNMEESKLDLLPVSTVLE